MLMIKNKLVQNCHTKKKAKKVKIIRSKRKSIQKTIDQMKLPTNQYLNIFKILMKIRVLSSLHTSKMEGTARQMNLFKHLNLNQIFIILKITLLAMMKLDL